MHFWDSRDWYVKGIKTWPFSRVLWTLSISKAISAKSDKSAKPKELQRSWKWQKKIEKNVVLQWQCDNVIWICNYICMYVWYAYMWYHNNVFQEVFLTLGNASGSHLPPCWVGSIPAVGESRVSFVHYELIAWIFWKILWSQWKGIVIIPILWKIINYAHYEKPPLYFQPWLHRTETPTSFWKLIWHIQSFSHTEVCRRRKNSVMCREKNIRVCAALQFNCPTG